MTEVFKVPLVLAAQPEGGFTVTSPVLPELVTEGDTLQEAIDNVHDALGAVIELYEDLKKPLPANLRQDPGASPIWFEGVEGQRTHVATLLFTIKDAAKSIDVAPIALETLSHKAFKNWVRIRGVTASDIPQTVEVEPFQIVASALKIRERLGSIRGDVNVDGGIDLSDAVEALLILFSGKVSGSCLAVRDFNGDGHFNIADPISTLRWLYEGAAVGESVTQVDCDAR